ncbi:hypothetical protein K439DRAFT_1611873 [Ramaria rubella]|nr:hypothetical protein K439DRAFT_1611873 [Ramaria rubella]
MILGTGMIDAVVLPTLDVFLRHGLMGADDLHAKMTDIKTLCQGLHGIEMIGIATDLEAAETAIPTFQILVPLIDFVRLLPTPVAGRALVLVLVLGRHARHLLVTRIDHNHLEVHVLLLESVSLDPDLRIAVSPLQRIHHVEHLPANDIALVYSAALHHVLIIVDEITITHVVGVALVTTHYLSKTGLSASLDPCPEPLPHVQIKELESEIRVQDVDSREKVTPLIRQLPTHAPPLGPRRPRTPTGPRVRSPAHNKDGTVVDITVRREDKGKGKEVSKDQEVIRNARRRKRSPSLPPGPRKRTRRSWSRSRSRSRSLSRFSRSLSSRSLSPRSQSHSPVRSRSNHTSERASSHAPRKDLGEKNAQKLPNVDDLIPPLQPRESRTSAQDAELKRIREQRAKLEPEHAEVTRAVRRAQHELDLAAMELRSAEERRKAAQRVHERSVKGFLAPVT